MIRSLIPILASAAAAITLAACSEQPSQPTPAQNTAPQNAGGAHTHDDGTTHDDHDDHDHDHDHAHAATGAGHGGGIIELGNATIGEWTVRASRDVGEINAGGDAPIDVWLTGDLTKVVAVRFWIGTEDGAGSVKAKADIEDPAEPNRWHTHAEISDPIPAGAKLWVEIESQGGAKTTGSFDLMTT